MKQKTEKNLKFPHVKTCPKCGNTTFNVAKTWWGEESFVQNNHNDYESRKESFDQEEYIHINCSDCGHEFDDVDDLYKQKA